MKLSTTFFRLFLFLFLFAFLVSAKEIEPICHRNIDKNSPPVCLGIGGKPTMINENNQNPKNVLGSPLDGCGRDPLTGFYRTGSCLAGPEDLGVHTLCAELTQDFLDYTKSRGNDLSTPAPQYGFPGLKAGQRWCLCAARWLEAHEAGVAPHVILSATHQKTLEVVPLEILKRYSKK